jgi:glutaredoxin
LKKVKLFALSTCGWCKKVKRFLDTYDVDYEFVDVDLLSGDERVRCVKELTRWNPRRNYPTLVIDDEIVIVGYHERRMREVLKL